MSRLYPIFVETLAAAAVLLPIFLLLTGRVFSDSRRAILCGFFGLYLSAVYALVGLPSILYIRFELNINTVPFQYMFSDLDATLLNVLLFVPLGLILPMLWKEFDPWWKTVLFGFFLSGLIEFLQIFTYRATDVNDLMTNTLGTLVGYLMFLGIRKLLPNLQGGNSKEFRRVCLLTFGILFFLQPFLSRLIWYFLM